MSALRIRPTFPPGLRIDSEAAYDAAVKVARRRFEMLANYVSLRCELEGVVPLSAIHICAASLTYKTPEQSTSFEEHLSSEMFRHRSKFVRYYRDKIGGEEKKTLCHEAK